MATMTMNPMGPPLAPVMGGPTPPMTGMMGGPGMMPPTGAGMVMDGGFKAGVPVPMMGPQAPAAATDDMPLPPMMPFPPQHIMDSGPDDGPISVAYKMHPSVQAVRMQRPAPDTHQYYSRYESWLLERQVARPHMNCDICGWVQATVEDQPNYAANNADMVEKMGIKHDNLRMCFQSISGWVLMLWRNQADFEVSMAGEPRAPRPIAWWDLRQAWDVQVELFDFNKDICPHRICVMMNRGCLYFRVELPEDVPIWFSNIKRLIQESSLHQVRSRDSDTHQRKRWPAACGLGQALASGWPIGERALAIAFHCYDLDYDGGLRNGEIMLLITELVAGMIHADGRAEGEDRETAMQSAQSRIDEDDLFDRALRFRRRCQVGYTGAVKKDDFILYGHQAMLEALDMGSGEGFESAGSHREACTLM